MKRDIELSLIIKYDKWQDKYTDLLLSHPLSVCLKVTEACNFNCAHCVSASSADSYRGLPINKIKEIIKILNANSVRRLNFSGGEPFLRKDFKEIIDYSSGIGLEIVITSNGSLIDNRTADYLKNKNVAIQISLDGDKNINDKLRGAGTFDIAANAIKNLVSQGVNVIINCTVQKTNCRDIDSLVKFAKLNKVKKIYFNLIRLQGRAKNKKELYLDFKDYEYFYKKLASLRGASKGLNFGMLDLTKYPNGFVLIEANGDLVSQGYDEATTYKAGNILRDNFSKMWNNTKIFDHAAHLMHYINH